jgi:hypothetical protein
MADLLFLEAWEARLAHGIAAILRARQIRRANPTLAGGIRSELARARPLAPPASRRRATGGKTQGRTELDRGGATTSPRLVPDPELRRSAPAELEPVPPGASDPRRDPVSGASGGEPGSSPGRTRGR